ncbi:probable cytochrome P450 28d1 [Teleopsis dalmanni]|uniref:probable cytochrome P450 28d1 n=1 Tax=Teleopsis dalmanni TaxID=139649 RepID=UPI0018CCA7A5|nr:probable cytochrome P450 28d1 [Teleopsis dalmanni]
MISLVTLALLASVPVLIYVFLTWNFDYWKKRGVRGPKPTPLLGSFPSLFTQKQHFANDLNDIYRKYKNDENYVSVFLMRAPQLMILDPALVHEVFVTAFKHFHDNDVARLVDTKKDPLIANNPFIATGHAWKEQRSLVSPGMTGTRIKVAYSVMQKVCNSFCDYIEKEIKMMHKDGINGKELSLRFTAENVCDSVLGINARSFTNDRIPVAENVKVFAENNTIFLIYSIFAGLFPSAINFYKAKFFPKHCEEFFINLMKQAFKMRQENKTDRQDFLNHLLSMSEKKELNYIELASHTMTFLIDGLDTTATAISHCLLFLARSPDVQEKLHEEIVQNSDENGELSFEKLNELPYLDACFHESIRMFPPGLFSTKICTEPYEFTNKNGDKLKVNVGETIMLPLYAIHNDPQIYPEPEKFDPERFMPENGGVKKYRDMGAFLGFGDGPRMCLGMRFALTQSKAALSAVIRKFIVKVNPKTEPINKLDPKAFLAMQDGGVWLDFEKRV